MKFKSSAYLLTLFVLISLFLSHCENPQLDTNKIKEEVNIKLKVELKNNIAHLSWEISNLQQLNAFNIKRCYATKIKNIDCDTCVEFTQKEFDEIYKLKYEDIALSSNSLNYNSFRDSLFSYNEELFYKIVIWDGKSVLESNYYKLKIPDLPVLGISPYKVLYDPDLNDLFIIDNSDSVKLYTFSLNDNRITKIYDFGFEATYLPQSDMCLGIFNGVRKLIFTARTEVFIFNLSDLKLETTFNFGKEYIGAVACDMGNYIYVTGEMGIISRIDYHEKTILKLNTLMHLSGEVNLRYGNGHIYVIPIGTNWIRIDKYKIQESGTLLTVRTKEIRTDLINDFDYCESNEMLVLSNGLLLDKNLMLIKDLDFPSSSEYFAFTEDGKSVELITPGTKHLNIVDMESGKTTYKKTLLSYPFCIFPGIKSNINIGRIPENPNYAYSGPDLMCIEIY